LYSKDLVDREVRSDLVEEFPELSESGWMSKLVRRTGNNQVASRVATRLYEDNKKLLRKTHGDLFYWSGISEELKKLLIEAWNGDGKNGWNEGASKLILNGASKHPISSKIKSDEFLKLN
jgi:hypothetical protein